MHARTHESVTGFSVVKGLGSYMCPVLPQPVSLDSEDPSSGPHAPVPNSSISQAVKSIENGSDLSSRPEKDTARMLSLYCPSKTTTSATNLKHFPRTLGDY